MFLIIIAPLLLTPGTTAQHRSDQKSLSSPCKYYTVKGTKVPFSVPPGDMKDQGVTVTIVTVSLCQDPTFLLSQQHRHYINQSTVSSRT